jgi:hypothetical protein
MEHLARKGRARLPAPAILRPKEGTTMKIKTSVKAGGDIQAR